MARIEIDGFPNGINTTDIPIAIKNNFLIDAWNLELTRNGSLQQRPSLSDDIILDNDLKGLEVIDSKPIVFTSTDKQSTDDYDVIKLSHPEIPNSNLLNVVDSIVYADKTFVIAEFQSSDINETDIFYFYDGQLISDWTAGRVRSTNLSDIAKTLSDEIEASSIFNSRLNIGSNSFTVWVQDQSKNGSILNETHEVFTNTNGVLNATPPTAVVGGGSEKISEWKMIVGECIVNNEITSISIGQTQLINANIPYSTDLNIIADTIIQRINNRNTSPNFTATKTTENNNIYINIKAETGTGAELNNEQLLIVNSLGSNYFTNVPITLPSTTTSGTLTKLELIDTTGTYQLINNSIDYTTDLLTTGDLLVSEINNTNNFEYSAKGSVVNGNYEINLYIKTASTISPTGNITSTGDLALILQPFAPNISFIPGIDGIPNARNEITFTISGSFQRGDRISITLFTPSITESFGNASMPDEIGTVLNIFDDRVVVGTKGNVNLSSFQDPTKWRFGDSNSLGALSIGIRTSNGTTSQVTAINEFLGKLVVFTKLEIQLWDLSQDTPIKSQAVKNTGTLFKNGTQSYGEVDLFYIAPSGVRSLRSRYEQDLANTTDVGTYIDNSIIDKLEIENNKNVFLTYLSKNQQLWAVFDNEVFIYNKFKETSVNGWTRYIFEDKIYRTRTINNNMILRLIKDDNGQEISYLSFLGGKNGNTYKELDCSFTTAFLDSGNPNVAKVHSKFNAIYNGQWSIKHTGYYENENSYTNKILLSPKNKATFNNPTIPISMNSRMISFKCESKTPKAKFTKMIVGE